MPLNNKKIIVTGGPTREWLDPVRFITNPSSGKMGIALADKAAGRGQETVFIHGSINSDLLKNKSYRTVFVDTTTDLLNAVLKELTPNSVLIMAAAPVDYAPAVKSNTKIKKESGSDELIIKFKKNPDILMNVAGMREQHKGLKNIFIVGFAAETDDIEKNAVDKLNKKNLDLICVNDVRRKDAGFTADTNAVTMFTRLGERIQLPLMRKEEVASRILDQIELEMNFLNR